MTDPDDRALVPDGSRADTASAPMGPTRPADREPYLDVVRGIAILGILLVNIEYLRSADLYRVMAGDEMLAAGLVERLASFGTGWLVAGKFLAGLAILFGVGVGMMAGRARHRGDRTGRLLVRRHGLLALLGLAHMVLLFPGDILFVYAVTGVLVLRVMGGTARVVLRRAVVLLAAVVVASVAFARYLALVGTPDPDDPVAASITAFFHARRDAAVQAFTAGGYGDILVVNTWEAAIIQFGQLMVVPWLLALFLLGVAVAKADLVSNLQAHRKWLRTAAAVGLGVGLPLNLVLGGLGATAMGAVLSPTDASTGAAMLAAVGMTLGAPLLAVGYLAVAALLCLRRGAPRRLAAVGRTALSSYLLQSLLALFLFAGLGWYDRLSSIQTLLVVAGIWTVLLLACPWWLQRWRFGPVEWLLRCATYGAWSPLRVSRRSPR
jgi:uncharacterized protein